MCRFLAVAWLYQLVYGVLSSAAVLAVGMHAVCCQALAGHAWQCWLQGFVERAAPTLSALVVVAAEQLAPVVADPEVCGSELVPGHAPPQSLLHTLGTLLALPGGVLQSPSSDG